ncbi:MAG: FIST N-terminal domain-containing protein [Planctomycetota bacterium]
MTTCVGVRRVTLPPAPASSLIADLEAALDLPQTSLIVTFFSSTIDRETLGVAVRSRLGETPVIGCTSAGEIGPEGFSSGGLTAFALPTEGFRTAVMSIPDVGNFSVTRAAEVVQALQDSLPDDAPPATRANSFVLLLIDGLSRCEEPVASALDAALGGIPLFGGSAGDGLEFASTGVLANGQVTAGSAVVALIQTDFEFEVFKTQHVVPTPDKLVVTAADPERRVVSELNGEVALSEYARVIGVDPETITPAHFAANPVVVRIGGADYVRSIQKAEPDGSLTFLCAIDEGLVLTLARVEDLEGALDETLTGLEQRLGEPQLVIACDCILRRLEIERHGLGPAVGERLARFNVVGFSTYGEQIGGLHVNQTMTGVAIGKRPLRNVE